MAKKRRQEPEPEEEEEEDIADDELPEDDDNDDVSDNGDDDEEELSSEEDEDNDNGAPEPTPLPVLQASSIKSDGRYQNKQRLLVLSSRGVTARYRHLLEDLRTLLPHSKKECKLDVGKNCVGGGYGAAVNEIAEARGCHTVLFLECRKRGQDGYLWLGRTSHANSDASTFENDGNATSMDNKHLMITGGPSIKFHITNIHTMDELKMTGNCMKGSRPILSFDKSFDTLDHLKLVKHVLVDVFGTPRGHPKSKPFVDRVMGFYYADKKVRDYVRVGRCYMG
ncbi:hypothetical protein ACHAWU_001597 [Discostella pseudostelligera]|uniref:Brix domain-containing protein n=1 Tax=Discostella pseudostelligera TaxID=259834 RepID=A0ABD3MH74_9STRA